MKNVREAITPQSLALVQSVSEHGSMAAAARELGLAPSAVTYRIRHIEETLDVLLFDRSGKHARITQAGQELLQEGQRVLQQLDAVARRVQRVATGWEPQLTIAVDSLISKRIIFELTEAFFQSGANNSSPPTRLRIQNETLSGTWHALFDGQADLVIGGVVENDLPIDIQTKLLGEVPFVFAVAPHHALASASEPLKDSAMQAHRIVAIADSTHHKESMSLGILPGQDTFTVSSMPDKLQAQIRGIGCGYLPQCIAQPYIDTGRLVVKATQRSPRTPRVHYAWHNPNHGQLGHALSWWLKQLSSSKTRESLLNQH